MSVQTIQETKDAFGVETEPTVAGLFRYPVKGLSPQPEESLSVTTGAGLSNDRRFALALGTTTFDPSAPEPLDKSFFLMLRRDERLAALKTRFDLATRHLTIEGPDALRLDADITNAEGRRAVEAFMLAYLGDACQGPPKLVEAPGHSFTDVSVISPAMMRAISLINLASVRDLSERCGHTVNPLRFRANIHLDGLAPWQELEWVGREVTIGSARFRCVLRTKRCAAIDVDPDTGARDTNLCKDIVKNYGHPDCGIYLEVVGDGTFRTGDAIVCVE